MRCTSCARRCPATGGATGRPTPRMGRRAHRRRRSAVLMARLGYDRYLAQGGDWGSAVSTALALRRSRALRRRPPEHGARVPGRRRAGRPHPGGGAPRSRPPASTRRPGRATRSSSRPDPRRSATAWSTRRSGSARGSPRSSGPGPTTLATPSTCWTATTSSTTSCPTGCRRRAPRRPGSTGSRSDTSTRGG